MTDEHNNKAKPSMPRRAAVIGACVGGILGLLLFLWGYGYGISISRIRIDDFLPYLPFIVMLMLLYPLIYLVSSKLRVIEIEDFDKRTMIQSLVILVILCLVAVLVVLPVPAGEFALPTMMVTAGAVLGALGFWLVADWINAWRQAGFRRVLFRTAGAACAILGLGLALALRLTSRGPLYTLCGIVPLLAFVVIGTVVDEIIIMAKEQEQTQDVEGNIQEVGSIVQRGPATYNQLKSLRGQYALILIGIVVVSCLLGGPAELALRYQGDLRFLMIAAGILSALLCAVVTGIYARKVGITRPIIPALIALLPFVPWIGLFTVVGHTPGHLKASEPVEDSRFVIVGGIIGLLLGLLPVVVMAILGLVNPRYVGQLFLGPPLGAYIPGLPIPCGWPILGMILLGVLLPPVSLGISFYRRLVRGWWKLLLVIIVLLQCAFPSVWLVLMGPAAVQVFKQFFGGRY